WSAAPRDDETPPIGFPCPRCGNALEISTFGRAIIKTCAKCRGCFVPALQFSFILNDYVSGVELPMASLPPPLPPSHGPGVDPRLGSVACIACGREMDRINFASRSGAIVDVCNMHGIWLDAGELVPILHFVKTRSELGEVPISDAERDERAELDKERADSEERRFSFNAEMFLVRQAARVRLLG
ncbi:MAG: zf-TFIIB domain-containing protein, partial [Polyangiaceae bacterium]